ncbi:hemerythrin domain-containing protein [Salinicola tamaricis]|uniref:hemerythrin domain-containing protein n=1 Tax=Salinicola tamaricis TaxID=1771309 RepID=UPI001F5C7B30|nr:hemerythrin domain-containing protein [Salinicola tamaricis]
MKTHGDSEGRDELFKRLRAELENHAAAEERALYIPMMEYDMTQEKARHSVAEHHEIDELIETLESTEYDSPGWLASAKKLQHLVTHHLKKRNRKSSSSGRVLGDADKTSLAQTYQQEMEARRAVDPAYRQASPPLLLARRRRFLPFSYYLPFSTTSTFFIFSHISFPFSWVSSCKTRGMTHHRFGITIVLCAPLAASVGSRGSAERIVRYCNFVSFGQSIRI